MSSVGKCSLKLPNLPVALIEVGAHLLPQRGRYLPTASSKYYTTSTGTVVGLFAVCGLQLLYYCGDDAMILSSVGGISDRFAQKS